MLCAGMKSETFYNDDEDHYHNDILVAVEKYNIRGTCTNGKWLYLVNEMMGYVLFILCICF